MKYLQLMILIPAILLMGCHKKKFIDLCNLQQDVNLGLIEEVLEIDCPFTEGQTFVVEEQTTYEEILSCAEGPLPEVDFGRHTLLGLTTGATGCERYYRRTVLDQSDRQQYLYSVDIAECGGCEPWVVRTHWVVVPRPPEGYEVEFRVRRPAQ